jgi:hypothetical protein
MYRPAILVTATFAAVSTVLVVGNHDSSGRWLLGTIDIQGQLGYLFFRLVAALACCLFVNDTNVQVAGVLSVV